MCRQPSAGYQIQDTACQESAVEVCVKVMYLDVLQAEFRRTIIFCIFQFFFNKQLIA